MNVNVLRSHSANNTKTIVTVASIRPDLPRLQALIKLLDKSEYNHVFISSGQHYDYDRFGIFLKELELRDPDIQLSSGAPGRDAWQQITILGEQLVTALNSLPQRPDLVLFLGDSNSVVSSIAVKRAGYRIGHIEAFMRAYPTPQDMFALGGCPLPEELNRRLITTASDIFFTYHEDYKEHAKKEGIPSERVFVISNTINEAVSSFLSVNLNPSKKNIIVDIHRQENIESYERLSFIMNALRSYKARYNFNIDMLDFGRTTDALVKHGIDYSHVNLVPLMGYKDYLEFQQNCLFAVSDSGSFSEEVANFPTPIPCICPRSCTERPRAVSGGGAFMLETSELSFDESMKWLQSWDPKNVDVSWVGSKNSSAQILNILREVDGKFW